MGATMSNSPSSASSNGSSFGSGSQGIGRSTRKGLFSSLLSGKRPVVSSPTGGELVDYGSPLSDASSPIDYEGWSASRNCANNGHHFFIPRSTVIAGRRGQWDGTGNNRHQHSYSSAKTTPSMQSRTSLSGRKKQALLNGWNQTKRAAASILPNVLTSSIRSRDSMHSLSKQLSPRSEYNDNNSHAGREYQVGNRIDRSEAKSRCHLNKTALCQEGKSFDTTTPPTVALINRTKAISKVREIFEAAARNRRQADLRNNNDGEEHSRKYTGANFPFNNLEARNAYRYDYSYRNEAQSPPAISSGNQHEVDRVGKRERLTSSDFSKISRFLQDEGTNYRQDNIISKDVDAVTKRMRHDLKLSTQVDSSPKSSRKACLNHSIKDFANNNAVVLEPSYEGLKAKTPLSPIHTSHPPLRFFKNAHHQNGLVMMRDLSNTMLNYPAKRHSNYTMAADESAARRHRFVDGVQQSMAMQRPLSWATYTRSDPSPFVTGDKGRASHQNYAQAYDERKSGVSGLEAPRRTIQASTSELLRALSNFVSIKSFSLLSDLRSVSDVGKQAERLDPSKVALWLRSVDRALILQGWQDMAFINPANLVFVYMLMRDRFAHCLGQGVLLENAEELHSLVLTCLYLSYSYMGNEISYPLKPFVKETTDRSDFWNRCIEMINLHSGDMLRLNASSGYFFEVFSELKEYAEF